MKVIDTYNAVVGGIVAVLSYIFGEHWILFALFLAFNVADWIPDCREGKFPGGMERRAEKAGILADDYGQLRSQRGIY